MALSSLCSLQLVILNDRIWLLPITCRCNLGGIVPKMIFCSRLRPLISLVFLFQISDFSLLARIILPHRDSLGNSSLLLEISR